MNRILGFTEEKEMIEDRELMTNAEGYPDPTAYEAIKNLEERAIEKERHSKLIGCILRVCELAGFSVEERIILRDNRTGRVWR